MHPHPENPTCTRAYLLVTRGQHGEAVKLLEGIGYTDATQQVAMIEGFIQFQKDHSIKTKGTKQHGWLL